MQQRNVLIDDSCCWWSDNGCCAKTSTETSFFRLMFLCKIISLLVAASTENVRLSISGLFHASKVPTNRTVGAWPKTMKRALKGSKSMWKKVGGIENWQFFWRFLSNKACFAWHLNAYGQIICLFAFLWVWRRGRHGEGRRGGGGDFLSCYCRL